MPVHYIFIVSRSICSLSTLDYSFNFRFAIWCGASIISRDLQSAFVYPSIICFSAFKKDPTFSRRIKGVSIVKRHCVCLDVFLHDSIYPCILSTDSYLSSRQLNLAFIFSHNRQTEGCKAACQAKNMKWAKVFKLGIWSWSLISSYMTKKSHNFGWFILKQCMLSHCLPEMSSSGNTDLDENSP